MKLNPPVLGLCVTTALLTGLLAACGNGGAGRGGGGDVVDGGTFTWAFAEDPGNLDPQLSAASALFAITQLAYDPLVSVDGKSGEIKPELATSWKTEGTTVTLNLSDGVTCADGSDFTASDAAANLSFVADPANKSPFLGTFLPVGATAKGDDDAGTVTIQLASPAPFVLNGLASLPMVCADGMDDRGSLKQATAGTGPYELTEAAPGDHYTYAIRDGYTWGPDGASTATKGMPDTITVKIVENESTAANLLLSGDLNAARVVGPDSERLEKSKLFVAETPAITGEQWYNHVKGRPTSDPKVRLALTQALDLGEIQKVLTAGKGTAATTLATNEPISCTGDSVSDSLPAFDADAAATLLDEAGWTVGDDGMRSKDGAPLELTFLYQNSIGPGGDAATELVAQYWKKIGVKANVKSQNETALTQTLFSAGDWDVSWVPLNVSSPDQLVPFLSGTTAPDGTNFSAIQDDDYDAAVKKASSQPGTEGCDTWLGAESGLIAKGDIVPFANTVVTTYGSGAEFATPGSLVPTSIRMMSK